MPVLVYFASVALTIILALAILSTEFKAIYKIILIFCAIALYTLTVPNVLCLLAK